MSKEQTIEDSFLMAFTEFYNRIKNIYTKEKLANRNALLNPSSQSFLVFFPILIGMISLIASPRLPSVNNLHDVQNYQLNLILRNSKIVIIFVVVYLLIYKFSTIKKNGQYGYWVALGINREKFFRYVNLSLTFNILLGQLTMVIVLNVLTPIKLEAVNFLILVLLLISSNLFLINFSLFVGEFIQNAELASIFAILAYAIIIFFAERGGLQGIFLSEYYYNNATGLLYFGIQTVLAVFMYYFAKNYHLQTDIELGG